MLRAQEITRRQLVRFLFPGALTSETAEREVNYNNPACIEAPEGAFAFQLFSRIHVTVVEKGKTLELTGGEQVQESMYYIGGKVYSLAAIKETFGNDKKYETLIDNMQTYNWSHVVQTWNGGWYEFKMGIDHVVPKID